MRRRNRTSFGYFPRFSDRRPRPSVGYLTLYEMSPRVVSSKQMVGIFILNENHNYRITILQSG